MPEITISGLKLHGVACATPKGTADAGQLAKQFSEDAVQKIVKSTGIQRRRTSAILCTSDLCHAAAERLLNELGWPRDSVTHLIFVSQSPDYVLPATSCALHSRLGLGKECSAFDVNLGCSGYVYGLWLAASLLQPGQRALLLAGDTISRTVSSQDRATLPIFGDAGSATALEKSTEAEGREMAFSLGTDGAGYKHIIIPAGGFRNPSSELTRQTTVREGGNARSDEHLFMNGAEVFAFTLREVPPLVERTLNLVQWSTDSVDAFVFHQANRFMLEHLAQKMEVPSDKLTIGLENCGNTSSASIPMALTTQLAPRLRTEKLKLLLAGFGVGWSWAAAAVELGPICLPDLIEVEDPPTTQTTPTP